MPSLGAALLRQPVKRAVGQRRARAHLTLGMPGQHGSLAVHQRKHRRLEGHTTGTRAHELVKIQRRQQHEPDGAARVPRRVGDLHNRLAGQPAECRFEGQPGVGRKRLLEVTTVRQLQFPAGAQRIAE